VSCWADASSAAWIPRLRECLGGVPIEAKGLLATEGVTSIPDETDGRPRLAAECHWHEFINAEGIAVAPGDLKPGDTHEVALTTSGGLYRYLSGDRVAITGMGRDGLPRLRFVGRAEDGSDLVGEKLHESFVAAALAGRGFLRVDADRPGYDLWLEQGSSADEVLHLLEKNPYLSQALRIGQLAPFRIRWMGRGWHGSLAAGLAGKRRCRIGDVKPPALLDGISETEVASWVD
jgi:hypothetical protein